MISKNTVWCRRKRKQMIKKFGGKCQKDSCSKKYVLEFAHKTSNHVNGIGRGSYYRIHDVIVNPDNYFLFCKLHHHEFDREVKTNQKS